LAAESVESVSTTASHFFPVLRGEVTEESWFGSSELRGYFSRAGRTELPPALAASGRDGYSVSDPTRPGMPADIHSMVLAAVEHSSPRVADLHGMDGRALIMSDRMRHMAGSQQETNIIGQIGEELLNQAGMSVSLPTSLAEQ